MRQLVGKFGPFIACSGYPECKYVHHVKAALNAQLMAAMLFSAVGAAVHSGAVATIQNAGLQSLVILKKLHAHNASYRFLIKKIEQDGKVIMMCSDKNCGYMQER